MNIKLIQDFLRDIAVNNNKEWFHANKARYERCKKEFFDAVEEFIAAIQSFDPEIENISAKDTVYRFNRDIRFSPDKSPYKRHFGAYVNAKGKKALRGGYYLHIQPDNCFVAIGNYWLPTNILTACRNEIVVNADRWRKAVENGKFIKLFGHPGGGTMADDYTDSAMSEKGFGITLLKKMPRDFVDDIEMADYLKMKDYCCWRKLDENIFIEAEWTKKVTEILKTGKPMMDFINSVVDDYE